MIYLWWGTATVHIGYGVYDKTNPVGIAFAVLSLLQGIVGFVFLSVICSMANAIIDIKENVKKEKGQ